ncbi:MAG TPA: sigma-70 family RNA polymerase sigma factor [Tepidisphaeraceae bacterium]|nr:sigma-70 family RNA polymerase sigma factor [Tepidisphaeraceae bacterium]
MNPGRPSVDELFRKYARGVGSYVYARVGDAHVAEQITSGVFLHVVRKIDTCRDSPQAWLWSIVRNELARYFRDHKSTEALPETLQDRGPSPHDVAEREETRGRMRDALAQLNEQQQRIVYLKFFQGVSNMDIASDLGISASNVGVIVHRAMARLRELLEGDSQVANGTQPTEAKDA